jgi:hypothetical protein
MRPRYKPPRHKRYFHTKPRIDNRDMAILKKKIFTIKQKNKKKTIKDQNR